MTTLSPFRSAASTDVGGLVAETDEDRLVLSGSIEIRLDRQGLADVEALSAILARAAHVLKSRELPERTEPDLPPGPAIDNPLL